MTSLFKPLLIAAVLYGAALTVSAQPMGPMGTDGMMHGPQAGRMGHWNPANMQALIAKRTAELKAKLKITTTQEGAWSTFTESMKPSADLQKQHLEMRKEMSALTTPQRIDRMRALRTERMTAMDKRADAVKTFYAVLTPEQQTVFDATSLRYFNPMGPRQNMRRDRAPAKQ